MGKIHWKLFLKTVVPTNIIGISIMVFFLHISPPISALGAFLFGIIGAGMYISLRRSHTPQE